MSSRRCNPERRADCTEGGEALLSAASTTIEIDRYRETAVDEPEGAWHALWTHSHCEQVVHDQLQQKGFDVFLPKVDAWSRRRGVRRLAQVPMFPGYLFLRHAMDKASYVEVVKTRGLVSVLGERWDRLTVIPEQEMQAVQTVVAAHHPLLPFPYVREGQRARIASGPLAGVEGILVDVRPRQGLLVLSVHLLQRSVAVVVDGTDVVPA
jgi:transcription termination/antitermination protein NusG